jgi:hypothetical protein
LQSLEQRRQPRLGRNDHLKSAKHLPMKYT